MFKKNKKRTKIGSTSDSISPDATQEITSKNDIVKQDNKTQKEKPSKESTESAEKISCSDDKADAVRENPSEIVKKDTSVEKGTKIGSTSDSISPDVTQEITSKNDPVRQDNKAQNEKPSKQVTESPEKISCSDDKADTVRGKLSGTVINKIPVLHRKKYGFWQGVGESVVGLAHRRGITPTACQDAHCIDLSERLIAVVCDGAGSSVLSEVGSQQMSQSIVRLFYAMEPILTPLLDTQDSSKMGNKVAEIIYRYSIRLLQDMAKNNKRETRDFRTTLLLIVAGNENLFWYKVGDGEIIIEYDDSKLSCIGKSIKGEYSNETIFVDETLKIQDVQYGLLNSATVTGIALMSDGGAERLVSTDRSKIAPQLSKYLDLLRNSKLQREELYKFLTDYETWRGTTHDDKTLLVAARKEE
jgi:hypothetical protein